MNIKQKSLQLNNHECDECDLHDKTTAHQEALIPFVRASCHVQSVCISVCIHEEYAEKVHMLL